MAAAEPHRFLRRLLDEGERRAAVIAAGKGGGAELERLGGRVDFLRADRAHEQQRHIGALRLRHHRGVGGGQAREDQQADIVLGEEPLRVGRGLGRLRLVIEDVELDLPPLDAALRLSRST